MAVEIFCLCTYHAIPKYIMSSDISYWEPEDGNFETLPKWKDVKADLLKWLHQCWNFNGYPTFRTKRREEPLERYPLNSVLLSCFGGTKLPERESWFIQDVPDDIITHLDGDVDSYNWLIDALVEHSSDNPNGNSGNPHNNPNHNEDDIWQQREATHEHILDRLKLKESGVKIDEPPLLVTVGATHTVVGEVDGLKLNFALGEIAQGDTLLFDTFRIRDRLWHVKKSIALSTLKGRQKAQDKREGKQMKMYEEWGGLAKFEKKEEYNPTTVIEKLADDALHKRGWWQDKL